MNDSYVSSAVDSFRSVPEILSMPEDEEEWIIRGLLRTGTHLVVYGREGKGKSRLLYQLAASLDSGGSWFGFDVEDVGNVVFLQADMAPKESRALLEGASREGLVTSNVIFPTDIIVMDVLETEGRDILDGLQDRFDPKVVIVDVASRVYRMKREHVGDVNIAIEDVINTFREAFPNAGFVYVLHERKKSQFLQAKGEKDEDAALGGGAWSRYASGVIRVEGVNDDYVTLTVEKTRSVVPFKKTTLRWTPNGFFEVETRYMTTTQALAVWPSMNGAPPNLEEGVTVSGVCRDIEKATKGRLKADSVRQAYYRAKASSVIFGWEKWLQDV